MELFHRYNNQSDGHASLSEVNSAVLRLRQTWFWIFFLSSLSSLQVNTSTTEICSPAVIRRLAPKT